MNLLRDIFCYAIQYNYFVFAGILGLLALNFVFNLLANAYCKSNRQIKRCKRILRALLSQQKLLRIGDAMPPAYRNQWKCFVFTTDVKPSEAMSFVKTKQPTYGIWLNVLTFAVTAFYAVCVVLNKVDFDTIPLIVAYFVASFLFAIILHFNKKRKEKHSRKLFASLVTLLDFCLPDGVRFEKSATQQAVDNQTIDEAVQQIEVLKNDTASGGTLSKVSEVLRQKGLNGNRTAEQQRKLNIALNKLLQSVCKQQLQPAPQEF